MVNSTAKKSNNIWKLLVVLFIGIIILGKCAMPEDSQKSDISSQSAAPKLSEDEKRQAENERKIAEAQREYDKSKAATDAMRPFEQQNYPKMYAKYGTDAMQRVNTLLPEIGNKVSKNKYCDKIEMSGISDRSTSENMVVYVNCENLTQYHISEKDIENNIDILPSSTR